MLTGALLLSLSTMPSPAAFHGALLGEDAGVGEPPPAQTAPLQEERTAEDRDAEAQRLIMKKPWLFGPIFAFGMGAVVVGWGLYIAIVGAALSGALYWFIPGALVVVLGLALEAVGVVRLVSALRERRAIDRRIDELRPPQPSETAMLTVAQF